MIEPKVGRGSVSEQRFCTNTNDCNGVVIWTGMKAVIVDVTSVNNGRVGTVVGVSDGFDKSFGVRIRVQSDLWPESGWSSWVKPSKLAVVQQEVGT